MEPRKWQSEAIDYFFKNNTKMIAVVPTGAGKTFFSIMLLKKIFEREPGTRVLIVVPKIVIADSWVDELMNSGFHYNKIGLYKGGCKEFSQITITTTSSVIKVNTEMFDFVIFDEVHNFGTPNLLNIIKRNHKYKLGLSATPERSDYKHWKIYNYFDYNIYNYSLRDAFKDQVLNKYDFYDIILELNPEDKHKYEEITLHIANMMKLVGGYHAFLRLPNNDIRKANLMKLFDRRKKLVWNNKEKMKVVSSLCKYYNDRGNKVIVFSQYNTTTNNLYYYLGSENIKAKAIHSSVPNNERKIIIKKFSKGEFNILLATKVLDEGFNLPSIDVGIILAGEQVHRQTVQRLGRVLRKKDKNSKLFQLYFDDTFEAKVAKTKSEFFREHCDNYEKVKV